MRYRAGRAVKRSFDIVAALGGLVVCFPFIALVGFLVRWRLGSPVLFAQQRTGYQGRRFRALKFRTMTSETDVWGFPLPDDQRLTRLGALLRKLSLDEIPQLINVLRGEMSLIGPRPLFPRYDPWYTTWERRRFQVRPGITGLAQVAGRNLVRWDHRLSLDVEYVDRWSLWLDVKILAQTARRVLGRDGVVHDPRTLMRDLDDERSVAETIEMSTLRTQVRELLRAG